MNSLRTGQSIALFAALALAFVGGCNPATKTTPAQPADVEDAVSKMYRAMNAQDWDLAATYVPQALIIRPNDPDLITSAAMVSGRCGRKQEAAEMLVDAAKSANYSPSSRVDLAVQALVEVGELYSAINLLEDSVQHDPTRSEHRRILIGFLGEVQRIDRIPKHLHKLIQDRNFTVDLLIAFTDPSTRQFTLAAMRQMMSRNAKDHRVRLPEAFQKLNKRDSQSAEKILREILEHHPDFAIAHAMHGQALVAENRWTDLGDWFSAAPTHAPQYAGYWLTLGDLASHQSQTAQAVHAYWRATKCDPINLAAWNRLSQSARRLKATKGDYHLNISDQQCDQISQRSLDLLDYRNQFNHFRLSDQTSQREATLVATSLLRVGRYWEAEAWSAVATQLKNEPADNLSDLRNAIVAKLAKDQSWIAKNLPVFAIDLSSLPAPKIGNELPQTASANLVVPEQVQTNHIRLEEESDRWGLTGTGTKNDAWGPKTAAIVHFSGAGGGSIDYDLDGLPDLLAMGAGGEMLKMNSEANALMRNLGERFSDATLSAMVGDKGFGQGVAVGDFNEDGFPDLLFANLGANRLFRNNGDGSFSDCSSLLVEADRELWSTSAAMADLNKDGIADVLLSNYCKIVPKLSKPCEGEAGNIGPCYPLEFAAEADQLLLSSPAGKLKDFAATSIGQQSTGRGLGVLAGALQDNRLGVFVANDMSRNSYYVDSQPSSDVFADSATVRGLAVDARTLAQASMGIASSDFDLDGDIDLYVTGFSDEYNVYYEQVEPGIWQDRTQHQGLAQPTLALVGFGTEAIDLDDDGIDEIVVTNGHIGDIQEPDSPPYAQPFQIFRRGASGRFELVQDDGWGDYFAQDHVGRALWTTDVNLDGRSDIAITHNCDQVRLLVNRSKLNSHRIGFQLVGTKCSRDAVGAVLTMKINGESRTMWVRSGDGYLCSNERVLRAGLGSSTQVDQVTVTWQDGTFDHFGSMNADSQYLLVQGERQAFQLESFNER